MFKIKTLKLKSLSMIVMLTIMLTACAGNDPSLQTVMTSDNDKVTGGMYLAYMIEAFSEAQDKVGETHDHMEGTSHDDDNKLDVLSAMVDGKEGRQWIIDEALKSSRLYFAVKREASKRQMGLTDDEKKAARLQAESQFEYFKEYYEQNGIGEDSLTRLLENKRLYERIFDEVYGDDGEQAISNEEIIKFDDENYDKISYVALSLLSGDDEETKKKNEQLENMTKEFVEKINAGVDYNAEAKAFLTKTAEITGQTAPSDDQTVTSEVFVDRKNYSTLFDKDFTEQIINTSMNKGGYKNKDNTLYIYKKVEKTEEDRNDRKESMRRLYKDDTFIDELIDRYKGFYIEINQAAVDFYTPDKIKNQ